MEDLRLGRPVRSAGQQIVTALTAAILDGSLPPGARLPSEDELGERFGVSRPTIRQALHKLRDAEVITMTRGRAGGYRVADSPIAAVAQGLGEYISMALGADKLDYAHLMEVRWELEILAARTAATRRTEVDLAGWALFEAEFDDDRTAWDTERALRYDIGFHRRLAESSHNPLVVAFNSSATIAFRDCGLDPGTLRPADLVAYLDEVRDAVLAGDPEAAVAAMLKHLTCNQATWRAD